MDGNRWLYFIVGGILVAVAVFAVFEWNGGSPGVPTAANPGSGANVNVQVEQPAQPAAPETAPAGSTGGTGGTTAPATGAQTR